MILEFIALDKNKTSLDPWPDIIAVLTDTVKDMATIYVVCYTTDSM